MSELWNAYLDPHPFDFSLIRQSETTYVLRVEQQTPVPPELSVLFGEWLYNMRSALDYIVWATAVHTSGKMPPPGEGVLQYPIYEDADAWSKNLYRLKPLAEHHRAMLLMMQPFNSEYPEANFLGWINRLARIDRHRRLAIWTARLAEATPVLAIPSGVSPRFEWGQFVLRGGTADLARLTFPDGASADGVSANPRVGIDPEIEEWSASPFWKRVRFSERLRMMHVFLYAEVGVYEYDCTGASDYDAMTDEYKALSDMRRAEGFFPEIERDRPAKVQWVAAGPAKPSSRERLMGLDFPSHGPGPVTHREEDAPSWGVQLGNEDQ